MCEDTTRHHPLVSMRADGGKEQGKREVVGEPFSGGHDIHASGVAKPAQDLFTVLPCQAERPHARCRGADTRPAYPPRSDG